MAILVNIFSNHLYAVRIVNLPEYHHLSQHLQAQKVVPISFP